MIIKTIRLHYNNLLPWITKTDIKIVQLVRDPRAKYRQTLKVLERVKETVPSMVTKTSIMLGLGEC